MSLPRIPYIKVTDYFLPKVAREYNIIDEASTKNRRISHTSLESMPSLVASSLLSNNRIDIHTSQETSTRINQDKKEKKSTSDYLKLGLIATATAVTTAFSFGRLRSSIETTTENLWHGEVIMANCNDFPASVRDKVYAIAYVYHRDQTRQKNKLSCYQSSLVGMALGGGLYVMGALASVEILSVAGIIISVASLVFGTYHAAVHWDDFTKTRNELKNLKLLELLSHSNPASDPTPRNMPPPPYGWMPSCHPHSAPKGVPAY